MKSASVKWLVGLGVVLAAAFSGSTARAHGDSESHAGEDSAASGEPGQPGGEDAEHKKRAHDGEHGEHEEHEEHEGRDAHVGVDFVLGFGKTAVAVATPSSVGALPSYGLANARLTSESAVLGTAFKILPHTSIGLLLPIAWGQFSSSETGGDARGTTALGAIEIEGEYERDLAPHMELEAALGISLPTAQGNEIPENLTELPNFAVTPGDYDKAAVNRAAALSRGGEVNSLWEPKRLGFNPKIGIGYEKEGLHVSGYLKMENLIATVGSLEHKYLGELVPGVRAGYRAGMVEPALKLWANIAFAGTNTGEKKFGLAVEPQVAFHLGNVRPMVGVIVPVVGPGVDPYQFLGVRAAVAAAF